MLGYTDAYLDIETTGLYSWYNSITVVGIYFCGQNDGRLVQLYNENLTPGHLLEVMQGTENLFTYNGERFDLPFIRDCLGPDLSRMHKHQDLMFDCWRCNLRGGLKAVLHNLGIDRETEGLTGMDAVRLWRRYRRLNDLEALSLLLRYNRDDVVNLKQLRESLSLRTPSDNACRE